MKQTILAVACCALIHGHAIAGSSVVAETQTSDRFIGTGVGGSYLEAIEDMFDRVLEICGETHQYPHLDSNILTFPVGTFVPVRAHFVCAEYPNGIFPKTTENAEERT